MAAIAFSYEALATVLFADAASPVECIAIHSFDQGAGVVHLEIVGPDVPRVQRVVAVVTVAADGARSMRFEPCDAWPPGRRALTV